MSNVTVMIIMLGLLTVAALIFTVMVHKADKKDGDD